VTNFLAARTRALPTLLLALLVPACSGRAPSISSPNHNARPGIGPRAGAIRGVVRDVGTGQPLSFATVYAHSPALRNETSATTAGDGQYRLADLDPGEYRITARYSDFTARYEKIAVRAGKETLVDIRILASEGAGDAEYEYSARGPSGTGPAEKPIAPTRRRKGTIQGTVLDNVSGTVLPGAVVSATAPHMRDAQFAMADDKGGFRFLGLRPGVYTLSIYYHLIERGNIEVRKANIDLRAGQTVVVDLELDAKPYD